MQQSTNPSAVTQGGEQQLQGTAHRVVGAEQLPLGAGTAVLAPQLTRDTCTLGRGMVSTFSHGAFELWKCMATDGKLPYPLYLSFEAHLKLLRDKQ